MPSWAVGLVTHPLTVYFATYAPADILSPHDGLKVRRIDARPNAANVVKIKALRHGADDCPIHSAMCALRYTFLAALRRLGIIEFNHSVPATIGPPHPEPAARVRLGGYLGK